MNLGSNLNSVRELYDTIKTFYKIQKSKHEIIQLQRRWNQMSCLVYFQNLFEISKQFRLTFLPLMWYMYCWWLIRPSKTQFVMNWNCVGRLRHFDACTECFSIARFASIHLKPEMNIQFQNEICIYLCRSDGFV